MLIYPRAALTAPAQQNVFLIHYEPVFPRRRCQHRYWSNVCTVDDMVEHYDVVARHEIKAIRVWLGAPATYLDELRLSYPYLHCPICNLKFHNDVVRDSGRT